MVDELNQKLQTYYQKWGTLQVEGFAELRPTAAGWKVADEAEYERRYKALRPLCDRIVETWMNGRWIAKMHLKDQQLEGGITIVKLMQRRPGSDDELGLDHVDFLCPDIKAIEATLQASAATWSWESNDVVADYDWISVWFDNEEAKIKQGTVVDIVITELQEINEQIKR